MASSDGRTAHSEPETEDFEPHLQRTIESERKTTFSIRLSIELKIE
jgi:hypothetical protein